MIFRDRDETETRNLDREMREIENETRISWWISQNFTLKTRDSRREFFISLFSRPRRDRDFCRMIFRDRDETETRNLDREIREIETETRVSSNPAMDYGLWIPVEQFRMAPCQKIIDMFWQIRYKSKVSSVDYFLPSMFQTKDLPVMYCCQLKDAKYWAHISRMLCQ